MLSRKSLFPVISAVIAVCLIKIAFFGNSPDRGVIPGAYAEGGVIEWKDAKKIVTAGNDGATTYVWDYEGKTRVRKYSVSGGKLTLEVINLEGEQK